MFWGGGASLLHPSPSFQRRKESRERKVRQDTKGEGNLTAQKREKDQRTGPELRKEGARRNTKKDREGEREIGKKTRGHTKKDLETQITHRETYVTSSDRPKGVVTTSRSQRVALGTLGVEPDLWARLPGPCCCPVLGGAGYLVRIAGSITVRPLVKLQLACK